MLYGIIIFLIAVCFVLACFIAVCAKQERAAQEQLQNALAEYQRYNIEVTKSNHDLSVELKAFKEENNRLTAENDALTSQLVRVLATAERKERKESEKVETQEEPVSETAETHSYMPPAGISTNFFCCEPYDRFSKSSAQYRLQQECVTELETGLRVYIDKNGKRYYTAALAGAYGTEIGRAYAVELQNGTTFNVILGDYKHPIDNVRADDYGDWAVNYDGEDVLCVIEFIADMALIPRICKDAGTMSALEMFGGLYGHGGNIVSVEDLGRVWNE